MSAPLASPPPLRPRRRLRFTLRLLLAGITLLCLALGWWTHRAREQRRAIDRIEAAGGGVAYNFFHSGQTPAGEFWYESSLPPWLNSTFGYDFFHTAIEADIYDRSTMPELRRLPYLQDLFIKANDLTDEDLAVLSSLPRLRTLWVHGEHHGQNRDTNLTLIGDRSLDAIAALPQLERASIHGRAFSRKGIEALSVAPMLDNLEIASFDSNVNSDDFEPLKRQGRIRHLDAWRLNPKLAQDYESIAGW
jgi:hypothetical protein